MTAEIDVDDRVARADRPEPLQQNRLESVAVGRACSIEARGEDRVRLGCADRVRGAAGTARRAEQRGAADQEYEPAAQSTISLVCSTGAIVV